MTSTIIEGKATLRERVLSVALCTLLSLVLIMPSPFIGKAFALDNPVLDDYLEITGDAVLIGDTIYYKEGTLAGVSLKADLTGTDLDGWAGSEISFTGNSDYAASQAISDGDEIAGIYLKNNSGKYYTEAGEADAANDAEPFEFTDSIKVAADGAAPGDLSAVNSSTAIGSLQLTATVSDISGISKVTAQLGSDPPDDITSSYANGKYTYEPGTPGWVTVVATDGVGNESNPIRIWGGYDTDSPVVSAKLDYDTGIIGYGDKYNGKATAADSGIALEVTVSEIGETGYSCIDPNTLSVSINGAVVVPNSNWTKYQKNGGASSDDYDVYSAVATVNLKDVSDAAKYVITVSGKDYSGKSIPNAVAIDDSVANSSVGDTIYLDTTAPTLDGIQLITPKSDASNSNDSTFVDLPAPERYGYYFGENSTIRVNAVDSPDNGDDADSPSGVQGMKIVLHDTADDTYKYVDASGQLMPTTGLNANVDFVAATFDTDHSYVEFTIDSAFKGFVYVLTKDNVGNKNADYMTPDGIIVEDVVKHEADPFEHILINIPNTNKYGAGHVNLYNSDITATISAVDSYSGLHKVQWQIVSDGDAISASWDETLEIPNTRAAAIAYLDGNAIDYNLIGATNLVSDIEFPVLIDDVAANQEENNLSLYVKTTDRAGNESTKSIKFSIDKKNPEISVTYNQETEDLDAQSTYYKQNRTATIVVSDANFDPSLINIVRNTNGVGGAQAVSWNASGAGNRNHTATVSFDTDGVYSIEVTGADLATNPLAKYTGSQFTVDKTLPTINISVSGKGTGDGGKYFATTRTAMITIKEHNFDLARVNFEKNVGGDASSFPVVSWADSGDAHTATFDFNGDGIYSFSVFIEDRAGNDSTTESVSEFVIDQTVPKLVITGVEDKHAYNSDDIIPGVQFTDTNYERTLSDVRLTGAKLGLYDQGVWTTSENGETFTYINIPDDKDHDDLYTLTAKVTDQAGNASTVETVQFSVNRYGSVFVADDTFIADGISQPYDIVFHEYNVNEIAQDKVALMAVIDDTNTKKLTTSDYTLSMNNDEHGWSVNTYIIPKSFFSADGWYNLKVHSEHDAALLDSINENLDEVNDPLDLRFAMDQTAPDIYIESDLTDNGKYYSDSHKISANIKDNLGLAEGDIVSVIGKLTDGSSTEVKNLKWDGSALTFAIPESSQRQSFTINVTDIAGNSGSYDVNDVLVTSSLFWRWYYNMPLFAGTIVAAILLLAGAAMLIVRRRTKRRILDV